MDDEGQPLEEAKQLAGKRLKTAGGESIQVELITSRPSFEFWLLLHFEYSSRPYATAAMVMNSLRAYLTNYSKSDEHVFAHVDAGLERALTNVQQLKQELAASGSTHPDTNMHILVSELLARVQGR
jgi:RloB-like protein